MKITSRRDDSTSTLLAARVTCIAFDPTQFRRRMRALVACGIHTDERAGRPGIYDQLHGRTGSARLVENEFSSLVVGEDPNNTDQLYVARQERFRSAGWPGLASRAYAAIDIALWDLKASPPDCPYSTARRRSAGGLVLRGRFGDCRQRHSADDRSKRPGRSWSRASSASRSMWRRRRPARRRSRAANPRWTRRIGLARRRRGRALRSGNRTGDGPFLRGRCRHRLDGFSDSRSRIAAAIAGWQNEWNCRWLGSSVDDRDGISAVVADRRHSRITARSVRLGGITPLLKIAALAEAFQVAVVPFRLPEIGVHLACGLPRFPWPNGVRGLRARLWSRVAAITASSSLRLGPDLDWN